MRKIFSLICFIFIIFLSSCATSLNVTVQRPAELDLNGAKTLAVLPFSTEDGFLNFIFGSHSEEKIAYYLSDTLESKLLHSGYFSLVSPSKVKNAIKYNEEPLCDVYITGNIQSFMDKVHSKTEKEDDEQIEKFYRKVYFIVKYKVIDAKTQQIISVKQKTFEEESSSYENPRDVPTAFNMMKNNLDSFINNIIYKLEPHSVRKNISLLKDKSKNITMKYANDLVKEGNINLALEEFLNVYKATGLFEAGYNAARIMEAQGDYSKAENLMHELYEKTGNKKSLEALKDIRYEINSKEKLEKQLSDRNNNTSGEK